MNELKVFRYVALIEATSFLLLLVATLAKHQTGNEFGVKILGPIHGGLFLAYCGLAVMVKISQEWGIVKTIGVLFGAIVPFGGFVVDRKVLSTSKS